MKSILLTIGVLFIFGNVQVAAQEISQRTVSGKIVDAVTDEAIIFASVYIPSANIYCQSDLDGKFSLSFPDTCKTLEVSLTGYEGKIIQLDTSDTILVKLNSGLILGPVVITSCVPLIQWDDPAYRQIKTDQQLNGQGAITIQCPPLTVWDNMGSGQIKTSEQIRRSPVR